MTNTVDGTMFVNMLGGGVKTLNANRQLVNDLNVFPIPDGDTGDNMLSTISSGFDAVAGLHDETLEEVASRAASGMLLDFGAIPEEADLNRNRKLEAERILGEYSFVVPAAFLQLPFDVTVFADTEAGKKLIDAANRAGGKDNISVVLARF